MVNKAILIGNVGKDPEVKEFKGGKLAKFSLATTKKWKKDGQPQEKTQWHNIQAWRGLAEVIEKYVGKGMKLYIEGEIEYREHEGKYYTDIIASDMQMLSFLDKTEKGQPDKSEPEPIGDEKDLPF